MRVKQHYVTIPIYQWLNRTCYCSAIDNFGTDRALLAFRGLPMHTHLSIEDIGISDFGLWTQSMNVLHLFKNKCFQKSKVLGIVGRSHVLDKTLLSINYSNNRYTSPVI